jgi:hypothetical protein
VPLVLVEGVAFVDLVGRDALAAVLDDALALPDLPRRERALPLDVRAALNRVALERAQHEGYGRVWLSVEPSTRLAIRSYEKVACRARSGRPSWRWPSTSPRRTRRAHSARGAVTHGPRSRAVGRSPPSPFRGGPRRGELRPAGTRAGAAPRLLRCISQQLTHDPTIHHAECYMVFPGQRLRRRCAIAACAAPVRGRASSTQIEAGRYAETAGSSCGRGLSEHTLRRFGMPPANRESRRAVPARSGDLTHADAPGGSRASMRCQPAILTIARQQCRVTCSLFGCTSPWRRVFRHAAGRIACALHVAPTTASTGFLPFDARQHEAARTPGFDTE